MSALADRFELGTQSAEGGMGVVRRARDRVTGSDVALKLLREKQPALILRFVREAEALARLDHPAIVRHVAHGTTESGEPWLAMQWIPGESLAQRLGRGPLPIAEAIGVVRRLADALAHVHAAGITHRDLKPSNIVLEYGEVARPVLIDFGIARFSEANLRSTKTGVTMGTPGYMSPEQAVGHKDLDTRADVFALGAVLFECVAGRAAFEGTHPMAVLAKLMLEDPPPLRTLRVDVPGALESLVLRMLTKDREKRPGTMQIVIEALDAIGGGEKSGPHPSLAPKLTFAEQRLVTVVASSPPGAIDDTIEPEALTMIGTSEREHVPAGSAIDDEASRVAKLPSGALVALFTGDATPSDQAVRATRAAIAHARLTPGTRIVVATGRVVVTSHAPVGEVIERAVTALHRSKGAGVRLDGSTAGLAGERWAMRVVEGSLFEVVGERVREAPVRAVLGQITPFVGRDREIGLVEATFDEGVAEKIAHAILVLGPAGIGKSRLRREIVARLEGKGARVMLARGEILGAGGAYAMLAPLVRRMAGVQDGESIETQRTRLEARIASTAPPELARPIAEFLGELAGIAFPDEGRPSLHAARADPMLLGDRMREAWIAWMRAECTLGPVVLVLEDLQWGDRPTIQLVASMLRELAGAPLLVLALARPEVKDQFPSMFGDLASTEVTLSPIGKRAAESLVQAVLGADVPAETLDRIVDRAAGSPLFLEELARGVAGGRDDLPETVIAIAQARLDALDPEARRVLRAASVLGRHAYEGAIAAILGETPGAQPLRDALDALVKREILVRRATASLSGDREYAFRHDVLREAAYAMLPPDEGVIAHRLAGDWLESRGIEAPVVRAEHHERGGETSRAAKAWLEAARESLAGDDLAAALARAERGLRIDPPALLTAELHLVSALACRWSFRPEEAETHAAAAGALLPPGSPGFFRALSERILASARRGDTDALDRWVELAKATVPLADAAVPRVEALLHGGGQLALYGEAARAMSLVEESERSLGRPVEEEPRLGGRVHVVLAMIASARGDGEGAWRHHLATIERFLAIGDARSATSARVNAAVEETESGLFEDAIARLELALVHAERLKIGYVIAFAKSNLGHALQRAGRLDEAEHHLRGVLGGEPTMLRSRLAGSARIYLARLLLTRGDVDGARETARAAVESTTRFPPMHALALAEHARALDAAGDEAQSLALAARAHEILDGLDGMEEGESIVRLAYVEALLRAERMDEARAYAARGRDRIMARSEATKDPRMRGAFVERIAENQRLLELAAAI